MILTCDCTVKSAELKKDKNGNDYLDVVVFQQLNKYDDHVFLFGNKVKEFSDRLKPDNTVVLLYNRFYSSKNKREVFILQDVTPC